MTTTDAHITRDQLLTKRKEAQDALAELSPHDNNQREKLQQRIEHYNRQLSGLVRERGDQ
jgi:hypothetical protein